MTYKPLSFSEECSTCSTCSTTPDLKSVRAEATADVAPHNKLESRTSSKNNAATIEPLVSIICGAANPKPDFCCDAQEEPELSIFGPYEPITSLERIDDYIAAAFDAGAVAVDTETTSLQPVEAGLVGVSLCVTACNACYIPINHESADDQLPEADVLARLKPLLEDQRVIKIMQNGKFDWRMFHRRGINVSPIEDTLLASAALDTAPLVHHDMDTLSERHLNHKTIRYEDVTRIGRKRVGFAQVPIDAATEYAAEDADVTLRLWHLLQPRLAAENMTFVYETLVVPLIEVLARMEERGIMIDRAALASLSEEFGARSALLREEINGLAGKELNPGSPKQLGVLLYGEMGLSVTKRTKKGAASTDKETMKQLGGALPAKIDEWRGISKLKSTYTDAMQKAAIEDRVHTNYKIDGAKTGRLSSKEPNLQNIPRRSEDGQRIRRAFIAPEGRKLIRADYNQVELRLFAHIAQIKEMLAAFKEGKDIHRATAAGMFKVLLEAVSEAARDNAKAINFGIIYGMREAGLAKQLGISKREATMLFLKYHKQYPGIIPYIDKIKASTKKQGYVTTVLGRKCHYPDICSKDSEKRAYAERQCVNMTIQGSAADIIFLAMARMEPALAAAGLSAKMLLQVHDELLFEAPNSEVEETMKVVTEVMVNAPNPFITFETPLKVDVKPAQNWAEAK